MRRLFRKPSTVVRFTKKRLVIAAALLMVAAGAYLLLLLHAPDIYQPKSAKTWNTPVVHQVTQLTDNRVYIPKLKLNLEYKAGDQRVLRDNLWHRYPEHGDPEKGGNFVLAGHRFEIGLTPGETARKSPLYHIETLAPGDDIYVDFSGVRYLYRVTSTFAVKPTQLDLEDVSATPKLTLYTCTIKGPDDGRDVVIAALVQKNVDPTLQF